MARGTTEEDVARACDALLLAGERPTIERVRLHLGRGSPNTVGPHLDAWFKGLGGRLGAGGENAAGGAIPAPVQAAATRLWEQALVETRRDFDARLRDGLEAAVANVEAEKERATIADAAAFEASARATHLQSELRQALQAVEEEKLARVAAQAQLAQATNRIVELQGEVAAQREQQRQAQAVFSADLARAHEAVSAAETRADGVSRRAMLEVDQARQGQLKSERQVDAVRRELAQASELHRAEALAQLQAKASLQGQLELVRSREAELRQLSDRLQQEQNTSLSELQTARRG